jgi:23S rRNA (cytosine1962-C5)-methyltransferase
MKKIEMLTPAPVADYELIDSGGREKLERFGPWTLARPEPQAVWNKALSEAEWHTLAHARFVRRTGPRDAKKPAGEEGTWTRKPGMPDRWSMAAVIGGTELRFRLALTSFGHIGIFPEQAVNWDFILAHPAPAATPQPSVLNLFAYTGGAS